MYINKVQNQAFGRIYIDDSAMRVIKNRFRSGDDQVLKNIIAQHSKNIMEISFHDIEKTGRIHATVFERGGGDVMRYSENKGEREKYSPLIFIKRVINKANKYNHKNVK